MRAKQNIPGEERKLELFIGEWNNTGYMNMDSSGKATEVTGSSNYHWGVGSKWLIFNSKLEIKSIGYYEVHGGVSFNMQSGKYDAFAANIMGNLVVYEGEWKDKNNLVFIQKFPLPEGKARIVYSFLQNGSFEMSSEVKNDQGVYTSYFFTDFKKEN